MSEGTISQVLAGEAQWCVLHGDSVEFASAFPAGGVDAIVCDPPYHLTGTSGGTRGFMGRVWDGGDVALRPETWAAYLDACKPGAHLLAFGGTRTSHRIACAIEDAGWEIRDSVISFGLAWIYGSGFPKSKNLGDGIGTALKPAWEPIILARKPFKGTTEACFADHGTAGLSIDGCRVGVGPADLDEMTGRSGASTPNQVFGAGIGRQDGAWEPRGDGRWPPNAVFTHTPLCRLVGTAEAAAHPPWDTPNRATEPSAFTGSEVSKVRHANGRNGEASADKRYADQGSTSFAPLPGARRDDTETVEQWSCVDGCPVRELSNQGGTTDGRGSAVSGSNANPMSWGEDNKTRPRVAPNDIGSVSRYFPQFQHSELDDITPFLYLAKAARSERDLGLEQFRARSGGEATGREDDAPGTVNPRAGAGKLGGARNCHPTVKPIELLRWLIRLVTPKGGIVLDPFAGSGSCGVAALLEGRRYIGLELNDSDAEPFVSIARARLHHVEGREFVPRESLRAAEPPRQVALFTEVG